MSGKRCVRLDFSKQLIRDIRGLLWVVTLGVFLSSLSALLLRRFDSKMQSVTTNPNSFGKVIPNIMFLGMMATLSAPTSRMWQTSRLWPPLWYPRW